MSKTNSKLHNMQIRKLNNRGENFLTEMNEKQVIKLTNSDVNNLDIRKMAKKDNHYV